ncbi:PKD domain-containing protein [Sorangium sp. So ce887]|uniref:PKD domain-containing protein n=1 Tax=Sorangium sp. So ce887 TaxID=3133324 RepID=UPI003F5D682C
MVIALALGASACDADKGGSTARESESNGSIQAALTVGGARHDVTGVHYKVVNASSPCSDTAIAETTSPLEEEALPGGALPPGAGTHAGADGLFVVPPGDYRVCATPMGGAGPSLECGPTEGIATVISEATTELFLVSQCLGASNGGLDTVVALNDPPAFQDLDIAPSKFITQCETATITAFAEDPDGDAISYAWELAAGAGSITGDGNAATFTPDGPGDVTVRVRATDALGGSSSLTFPIHVSAADCGTPGTTVEFSEEFTQGQPSSEQCGAWDAFRASLTGEYSFVTIRGSQDPGGVTCMGAAANLLCQALHDGTPTGPIECDGRTWVVGAGCGPTSEVVEITADGAECACTSGYTARPCIGNENWGGVAGETCFAPSQTISVVCGGEGGTAPTCDDGIQNQGETGVDCGGPCAPCTGTTVEFSKEFTQGQPSSEQCGAWDAFRASLTGEYSAVTIRGSQDPAGVTCTGAAANTLCQALHSGTPTEPIECDGRTWVVGAGCGPSSEVVEITADGAQCACTSGYTARPCIGNENWGGVGGDTCFAPSQTISVVCSGEGSTAPTCDDGIQNQGETGVDCGGPCAPCTGGLCDPATEVELDGHCYYLDGSGGACDAGYTLAPQGALSSIAPAFVGKTYKHQPSGNCCIVHSEQSTELQDWGMDSPDCNGPGPFQMGPMLGGAGCSDALNEGPGQLTLCMSL